MIFGPSSYGDRQMTNRVWKEVLESDRINNYDLETRLISIVSKPIKVMFVVVVTVVGLYKTSPNIFCQQKLGPKIWTRIFFDQTKFWIKKNSQNILGTKK